MICFSDSKMASESALTVLKNCIGMIVPDRLLGGSSCRSAVSV